MLKAYNMKHTMHLKTDGVSWYIPHGRKRDGAWLYNPQSFNTLVPSHVRRTVC